MATLLECIAANLGLSVDELVGTAQIKADLAALESQVANLDSTNQSTFSALGISITNLQNQITALDAASVSMSELAALSDSLTLITDSLARQIANTNSDLSGVNLVVSSLGTAIGSLDSRLISVQGLLTVDAANLSRQLSNQVITSEADFTAEWLITPHTTVLSVTLTADRTITLNATGAAQGARFRFTHVDPTSGGFRWLLAPLGFAIPANKWAEVEWFSVDNQWRVVASG